MEVGVGRFELGVEPKHNSGHGSVAVKGRPVQRRRLMLPASGNREPAYEHQTHNGCLVVTRGVSDLAQVRIR